MASIFNGLNWRIDAILYITHFKAKYEMITVDDLKRTVLKGERNCSGGKQRSLL